MIKSQEHMKRISDAKLGMHILEVEITTRCNLNCKHCYNRDLNNVDLPIDTFKDLLVFAKNNDVWTFVISGGEAMLHPQFEEITSLVRSDDHQMRIVLQTNGTNASSSVIENMRAFNLIHISYDISEDVRCGAPRNLELANILKKNGIQCYLFATIHKKNRKYIGEMVNAANDSNVPIGFNVCIPAKQLGEGILMSRDEFRETEEELFALSSGGKTLRYSSPTVSVMDKAKKANWQGIRGGCSAGISACVVGADGEVYPCPFFRVSVGNIFGVSLKKLWEESELFSKIRQRRKFSEPCGSCEYASYCGGCRNRAYVHSGDVMGSDPMCYRDLIEK